MLFWTYNFVNKVNYYTSIFCPNEFAINSMNHILYFFYLPLLPHLTFMLSSEYPVSPAEWHCYLYSVYFFLVEATKDSKIDLTRLLSMVKSYFARSR